MEKKPSIYVEVSKDGPYLVFGRPFVGTEVITPNREGVVSTYEKGIAHTLPVDENPVALCRCGQSKNKPFCDGSHAHGFNGKCTATHTHIMENAEKIQGPNLTLYDNEMYCAFARFCDAFGRVWNLVQEGTMEADKLAVREACNCPAGRLMIQENKTGKMIEPENPKEIAVLEDAQLGVSGPLYLKGSIPVTDDTGQPYETRARQTLCRCGRSGNKPFCDGSHAQEE